MPEKIVKALGLVSKLRASGIEDIDLYWVMSQEMSDYLTEYCDSYEEVLLDDYGVSEFAGLHVEIDFLLPEKGLALCIAV